MGDVFMALQTARDLRFIVHRLVWHQLTVHTCCQLLTQSAKDTLTEKFDQITPG